MDLREALNRVLAYLSLSEAPMEAWQVQDAIERAIAKTGTRTKRGRTLAFGNTMLVYLSPEAYGAIRPVERQVIVEIEENLPRELERVWKLAGAAGLRVALTADPQLDGLHMRVSAAERDVTPDEPVTARTRQVDDDVTPDLARVVVCEIGPRPRQWVIPGNRKFVIGRQPKAQRGSVSVDLEFDNPILSRLHVGLQATRLQNGAMGLEAFDLGSRNGTYIDGKQMPTKTSAHVQHGQVIRLGGRSGVSLRVVSTEVDPDSTLPMPTDTQRS